MDRARAASSGVTALESKQKREMKGTTMRIAGFAVAVFLLAFGTAPTRAADAPQRYFTLSSPAMPDFGYMPDKYTGNNPRSGHCAGQNISLPLAWINAPEGTRSFAITMFDPVPRAGLGFVHWVAYGIPGTKTALGAGEANRPTDFVGGRNGVGSTSWFGPCPPPTDYPHPYIITLVATDLAPTALPPGMTRDELLAALQGHALGVTTFIARYHKP